MTVGRGEQICLRLRPASKVHILCEEHHDVWQASRLAREWLLRASAARDLGFTSEQFARFAHARGMTARALKKRLLRVASDRARAGRREANRHDWATVRARQRILEENPWLCATLMGAAAYGMLEFIRRAA